MQNDENTLDTQEAQEESEAVVVEETTPEVKEESVKLSPAEYRHFLKWKNTPQEKVQAQPQIVSPQPNVEEVVLLANGMSEELLGELKAVASVRKTTLIKAQSDPIFVAVKEKHERELKQSQASMPASRGAGAIKPKKDFNTPGLTRDEHKAMVTGK